MSEEVNLKELDDEKLLDEYDKARGRMSYFNAAEGAQWFNESSERSKASKWMNEVFKELRERGLEGRPGNFLC